MDRGHRDPGADRGAWRTARRDEACLAEVSALNLRMAASLEQFDDEYKELAELSTANSKTDRPSGYQDDGPDQNSGSHVPKNAPSPRASSRSPSRTPPAPLEVVGRCPLRRETRYSQPQRGTGSCVVTSTPGCDIAIAIRLPHSMYSRKRRRNRSSLGSPTSSAAPRKTSTNRSRTCCGVACRATPARA